MMRDCRLSLQLMMAHPVCVAQAFASTFMDEIKNSTVASAGLPTKLNSQGDVDVPMEASGAFVCAAALRLFGRLICS